MISRGKDIELTIRRDTLIYEGVHTELEDGRQVIKIDISLEDIVNLLNQDVALIEVKGRFPKWCSSKRRRAPRKVREVKERVQQDLDSN